MSIDMDTPDNISKSSEREEGLRAFLELWKQAEENGVQDMSLEEINAEINAVRNRRNK